MVERRRLSKRGGDYFPTAGKGVPCIPTGCALLDCVLGGGGWALGRVSNIVGDRSTGKTLLAIEACANFARKYPKGKIWYRESEAAFDTDYAESLGLPLSKVDFGPDGIGTQWNTVEDVFEDLGKIIADAEPDEPGLYIIDSLDALSDRAELKRKLDEGTFGMEKAKLMSKLFRVHVRGIKKTNIHLMVVSQVREKIGVMFGEKKGRTGGKALDFYNSQELWLSHLKTLTQTKGGAKRATGIRILAKCKKLKVGKPFGTCEFTIGFGYGINDLEASLDWLEENKMLAKLNLKPGKEVDEYLDSMDGLTPGEYRGRVKDVYAAVHSAWQEVESRFTPKRKKYV